MRTPREIQDLIKKYQSGEASAEEKARLESWYTQWRQDAPAPGHSQIQAAGQRVWDAINPEAKRPGRYLGILPYAAVFLIALGFGLWLIPRSEDTGKQAQSRQAPSEIMPGGDKATLTLSDGRRIDLSDAESGEILLQSGIRISKNGSNQLVYLTDPDMPDGENRYNTITTPLGGQFQVILPDGSKVWLNAGSSLHYPMQFAASARKVELKGEAYFEVKKQEKPFIVQSGKQRVEVLGTHFNINAYSNEPAILTTLLEGSVRVTTPDSENGRLLKPGQQSVLEAQGISVRNVDPQTYVGWKNNLIVFESQTLGNIMRQIQRWYNVEVEFRDPIETKKFSGRISKYENVSQVLDMLSLTGVVRFKVEGRRIIVMQ